MRVMLLCLPHAGGSASRYHRWRGLLPAHVDVVPLELNGRGDRVSEPLYASLGEALDDLTHRTLPLLAAGQPFALFGHSMGAYLALELERRLESLGLQGRHLFLSGRGSPCYRDVLGAPVGELDDRRLLSALAAFGGMPPTLADHDELVSELFLPVLRADFRLLEDGAATADETVPVRSPITVLNGEDDDTANAVCHTEWQRLSTSAVDFRAYAGGHFFIDGNLHGITQLIAART
ncbi:thioesterase II family protein [Streptomyces carpaticus]|uniref:Thioesterase II family protein n=1 Tax=Streptomyces carpaticus TaxID=285558 RepID=A0ABV4ZNI8_9ACTN